MDGHALPIREDKTLRIRSADYVFDGLHSCCPASERCKPYS
jgi:hypothetical protein